MVTAPPIEIQMLRYQLFPRSVGLSDELQRRFFSHAGTPAPLGPGKARRPSEAWKAAKISKADKA